MDSYENDPSRLYGSAQVKENKNPQALHRHSSLKYALCVQQCCGPGFNVVHGSGSRSRRAKITHKKLLISYFDVLDVLF